MPGGLERRLLVAWFAVAAGFWLLLVALREYHPFDLDFAVHWAGTLAVRDHGAAALYDPAALAEEARRFHAAGQLVSPAVYLPVFFGAFVPLTLLPPLIGFMLWTLINLALAAHVARSLARRTSGRQWTWTFALLLFAPFVYGLYLGQPVGILLFGFARAIQSFEEDHDSHAGLWLGLLLLKPQYVVVLAAVLLAKRRWRAIGGLALAGTVALGLSAVALGPAGVRRYAALIGAAGLFRTSVPGIIPDAMVSWRGAVAALLPRLGQDKGPALTPFQSAVSSVALVHA